MGGSKPSSPTVIKPKTYQQVTPLFEYMQAADFLRDLRKQTNQAEADIFKLTGTPAEVGARNLGYQAREAAGYLSALPQGDKYTQALSGITEDRYAPLRSQAAETLSNAQVAYGQALQHIGDKPAQLDENYVPSWSTKTIRKGMPKDQQNTASTGTGTTV